jgi:membrane protein DedA with SNARE-associated domain
VFDTSVSGLLNVAGRHPALQVGAIVLGTFVLEDAATVLAALQAQAGAIWVWLALGSLYVGIVAGDIGLYGLGKLAAMFPWAHRWIPSERVQRSQRWLKPRVFKVVVISRFLPGARLPTYTACGFLGANFKTFTLATSLATLIWTTALFTLSLRVGRVMQEHLGVWRWAGAVGFVVFIIVAGRIAAKLQDGNEMIDGKK